MRSKTILILTILVMLLAVSARLIPGARTIDDAYITFRYARNLLAGQGLVYNPGQAVLGTTTPLYAFMLAGIGALCGGTYAPFPQLALVINAFADAMACMFIIMIAQELGYPRAGFATALVWAIAPMSVSFAIGGMETSFFIALMLATLYMYLKDRPVETAVLASFSLLTRPDALLFLLPLAADRLRRSLPPGRLNPSPQPITVKEIVAMVLPYGAWTVYALPFFGSPLPRSMAAKVVAYRLPPEAALVRLLQHYATPFLGHLTFGTTWIGVGLVLFTLLYGLGMLTIVRKHVPAWALFVYPLLYFIAFAVANPLIFRWYLTPPLPIYFLGIFLGAERLGGDIRSPLPIYLFAVLAFGLTLRGWVHQADHGPARPAPDMAYIELELLYQEAANRLKGHIEPDDVLAAGDIGALGYFSGAQVLDTVGLISPVSQGYYPYSEADYVINYAIPPDLILDQAPDFLVILEVYGRNGLLRNADFLERYQLLESIDTDIYGSEGMLIFRRNDA